MDSPMNYLLSVDFINVLSNLGSGLYQKLEEISMTKLICIVGSGSVDFVCMQF